MAFILNIDVSGQQGLVAISKDGYCIDTILNTEPMQHATFLQPAIQSLLFKHKIAFQQLNAVALSNGPGSYTGLRVGLASAKGLCFALAIPLITINSLQLLAKASRSGIEANKIYFDNKSADGFNQQINRQWAFNQLKPNDSNIPYLYCPMLDARRMEVFFGLYDHNNLAIINPSNTVITNDFLSDYLVDHPIIFTGSGAQKWKEICNHKHAVFLPEPLIATAFCELSFEYYIRHELADLALTEPFYCKEFYSPTATK